MDDGLAHDAEMRAWATRVQDVARDLDMDLVPGEPDDALHVRVEDLEYLARRTKALRDAYAQNMKEWLG